MRKNNDNLVEQLSSLSFETKDGRGGARTAGATDSIGETTPDELIRRHERKNKRHSRFARLSAVAAAIVAFCTTYALILPAITMETNDKQTSDAEPAHVATVQPTYETEAIQVNTPDGDDSVTSSPLSPHNADLTTAAANNLDVQQEGSGDDSGIQAAQPTSPSLLQNWEDSLVVLGLGADPAENLIKIANSQVGEQESKDDTQESGDTVRGRTLYGEWYGDPYADWNTLFVCFALEYAGKPGYSQTSTVDLANTFISEGIYISAEEYLPVPGNIAFIDEDTNGDPEAVGIIVSQNEMDTTVALGDRDGKVELKELSLLSTELYGYGLVVNAPTTYTPLCLSNEHTHSDTCFNAPDEEEASIKNLDSVNTQAEALACGQDEHTHTTECYDIAAMCEQYAESIAYAKALQDEQASYDSSEDDESYNYQPLMMYALPTTMFADTASTNGDTKYSKIFFPNSYENRNDPKSNVYLRALQSLGYQIDKRKQLSESKGCEPMALPMSPFTSKEAEGSYHQLNGYETTVRSTYWQAAYPAGSYISKTFANDFMSTGQTDDINQLVGKQSDKFGLACAGFTSYVYWHFIPKDTGIDLSSVLDRPQKTGLISGGNLVVTANPPWNNLKDVPGSGGDYTRAQGWWNAMLLTKERLSAKDPNQTKWTWYDFDSPERTWSATESGLGVPSSVNSKGQLKGPAPEIGTILCFFTNRYGRTGPGHMGIYAGRFPAYKTSTGTIYTTNIEKTDSGEARVLASPNEYRDYCYDVGSAYGPSLRVIPGYKLGGVSLRGGISIPPSTSLKLYKSDEKGKPVAGAVFTLYEYEYDHTDKQAYTSDAIVPPGDKTITYTVSYKDGKYVPKANLTKVATGVTDENGYVAFSLDDETLDKVQNYKFDILKNGEVVTSGTSCLPRYKLVETTVPKDRTTKINSGQLGQSVSVYDENGALLGCDVKNLDVYLGYNPNKPDSKNVVSFVGDSCDGLPAANEIISKRVKMLTYEKPTPDFTDVYRGYMMPEAYTYYALHHSETKDDQHTSSLINPSGSGLKVKKMNTSDQAMKNVKFSCVWVGEVDATNSQIETYVTENNINPTYVKFQNGSTVKDKQLSAHEFSTDSEGIGFVGLSKPGVYRVFELSTDRGTPLNWKSAIFKNPNTGEDETIYYTDVVVKLDAAAPTAVLQVKNDDTKLKIKKTGNVSAFDDSSQPLKGAKFKLVSDKGSEYTLGPTDDNGDSAELDIHVGETYKVYETYSPLGYIASTKEDTTDPEDPLVGTIKVTARKDQPALVTFEKDKNFEFPASLSQSADGTWVLTIENKLTWTSMRFTKESVFKDGKPLYYFREKGPEENAGWEKAEVDQDAILFEVDVKLENNAFEGFGVPWSRIGSTNKNGAHMDFNSRFNPDKWYGYTRDFAAGEGEPCGEKGVMTIGREGGARTYRFGIREGDSIVLSPLPPGTKVSFRETGRLFFLTPWRHGDNVYDTYTAIHLFEMLPLWDYRDAVRFTGKAYNEKGEEYANNGTWYSTKVENNKSPKAVFAHLRNTLYNEPNIIRKEMRNGEWPKDGVNFYLFPYGDTPWVVKNADGSQVGDYQIAKGHEVTKIHLAVEGQYIEYFNIEEYRSDRNWWQLDYGCVFAWEEEGNGLVASNEVNAEFNLEQIWKEQPWNEPARAIITNYYRYDKEGNLGGYLVEACQRAGVKIPTSIWGIYHVDYNNTATNTSGGNLATFTNSTGDTTWFELKKLLKGSTWSHNVEYPFELLVTPDETRGLPKNKELPYDIKNSNGKVIRSGTIKVGTNAVVSIKESETFFMDNLPIGCVVNVRETDQENHAVKLQKYTLEQNGNVRSYDKNDWFRIGLTGGGNTCTGVNESLTGEVSLKKTWSDLDYVDETKVETTFIMIIKPCTALPENTVIRGVTSTGRELVFTVGENRQEFTLYGNESVTFSNIPPRAVFTVIEATNTYNTSYDVAVIRSWKDGEITNPNLPIRKLWVNSDVIFGGFRGDLPYQTIQSIVGSTVLLEFENKPTYRPYTITKSVTNYDWLSEENKNNYHYSFTLLIKGNDPLLPDGAVVTGKKSDGTPVSVVVGKETKFTLRAEESLTLDKLPSVTECVVDEAVPDLMTVKRNDKYSINFPSNKRANHESEVTFVNTRKTAKFAFEKKIEDPKGKVSRDAVFDFDVFIEPNEWLAAGTTLEAVVDRTKYPLVVGQHSTVPLKKDQTAYVYNVPIGTVYTLTELADGYSTRWRVWRWADGYSSNINETSTIYRGELIDGEPERNTVYTNTPEYGSVEVVKTLEDPQNQTPDDTVFEFSFMFNPSSKWPAGTKVTTATANGAPVQVIVGQPTTVSLKPGETFKVDLVPAGVTYTVHEITAGFKTTIKHFEDVEEKGTIANDTTTNTVVADKVCKEEFINTPAKGNLIVAKTLEDKLNQVDPNTTFTFNLDIEANKPFLSEGEVRKAQITGGATTRTVDVKVGETATFNLKHGEQLRIDDLPAKTKYTVSEVNTEYETVIKHFVDATQTGQVRESSTEGFILAEKTTKEEVVNRVDKGGLIVVKTLDDPRGLINPDADFTFNITIDEFGTRLPAGQTLTAQIVDANTGAAAGTVDVVVGKDKTGQDANKFTLKAHQRFELNNLPAGVHYTVSETATGYTTMVKHYTSPTSFTALDGVVTEGKISSVEVAKEEFVNKPDAGNFEIVKTIDVAETGIDAAKFKDTLFGFTLLIQSNGNLPDGTELDAYISGGTASATNIKVIVGQETSFELQPQARLTFARSLPEGTKYIITERFVEEGAFGTNIRHLYDGVDDNKVTKGVTVTNTIGKAALQTEEFVNTPTVGLTIKKDATGLTDEEKAAKNFPFTVRIPGDVFYTPQGVKITHLVPDDTGKMVVIGTSTLAVANRNSTAYNFTLKSGEELRIDGLLSGSLIEVEETGSLTGYYTKAKTLGLSVKSAAVVSDDGRKVSGSVDAEKTRVEFTNHKQSTNLFITKDQGNPEIIANRIPTDGSTCDTSTPAWDALTNAKVKKTFKFTFKINPDTVALPANTIVPVQVLRTATSNTGGTQSFAWKEMYVRPVVVGADTPFELNVFDSEEVNEVIQVLNLPVGITCTVSEDKVGGYQSEVTSTQQGTKINTDAKLGYTATLKELLPTYIDFFNKEEWYNLEFKKEIDNPEMATGDERFEFLLMVESMASKPEFTEYTGHVYDQYGTPIDGSLPENQNVVVNNQGHNILQADGSFVAHVDSVVHVFLKVEQYCTVDGLPAGVTYTVGEERDSHYLTRITEYRGANSGGETYVTSKSSGKLFEDKKFTFINTMTTDYKLPESGSVGVALAISAGAAAVASVVAFVLTGPLWRRAQKG